MANTKQEGLDPTEGGSSGLPRIAIVAERASSISVDAAKEDSLPSPAERPHPSQEKDNAAPQEQSREADHESNVVTQIADRSTTVSQTTEVQRTPTAESSQDGEQTGWTCVEDVNFVEPSGPKSDAELRYRRSSESRKNPELDSDDQQGVDGLGSVSCTLTVTAAEAALLAETSAAVKAANGLRSKHRNEYNGDSYKSRVVNFDEAIRLTGHGKFHTLLLLVAGCLVMSGVLETVVVGYLLPSASCELGMGDKEKGYLGAASYVGIVLSSHTWGLIADTQGRRKALLWATLLDVLCSLASALAPNFISLLILRFLCGVFTSAPAALSFAYLGEFHTPATRSRSIIWIGAFPSIGLIILPGVAWVVLPQTWAVDFGFVAFVPWRLLLVLCACISFMAAMMLYFIMPESPKFLSAKDPQQALDVLRDMYAQNMGKPRDKYPVDQLAGAPGAKPTVATIELPDDSIHKKKPSSLGVTRALRTVWRQTAPLFKPPYLLHTLLVCVLQFGNLASANGLQIWLPEIFNRLAQYEKETATVCEAYQAMTPDPAARKMCVPHINDAVFYNNIIIGAASLAVPLLCGTIVNLVGKRNLLVICLLLTGTCGVCITLAVNATQVLALSCIIVAINAMGIGHISSIVVELFPTNLRAMAVSLHLMSGRLGSIVGNLIFGALLGTYCPYAFYTIGGALLTCCILSCCLPAKGKFAA